MKRSTSFGKKSRSQSKGDVVDAFSNTKRHVSLSGAVILFDNRIYYWRLLCSFETPYEWIEWMEISLCKREMRC